MGFRSFPHRLYQAAAEEGVPAQGAAESNAVRLGIVGQGRGWDVKTVFDCRSVSYMLAGKWETGKSNPEVNI